MAGASSVYLDGLFQLTAYQSGVMVGTSARANFGPGIVVTYNETTKAFDIDTAVIIVPVYGSMYVSNGAGLQSLTTAGTYYLVTQWTTAGLYSRVTVSVADSTLTVPRTGVYGVLASASFHGTNNVTYTFAIFVNGVMQTSAMAHVKLNASGDGKEVTITGILSLSANDVLDVRATSDSNGAGLLVQYGNFNVRSIA